MRPPKLIGRFLADAWNSGQAEAVAIADLLDSALDDCPITECDRRAEDIADQFIGWAQALNLAAAKTRAAKEVQS